MLVFVVLPIVGNELFFSKERSLLKSTGFQKYENITIIFLWRIQPMKLGSMALSIFQTSVKRIK